MDAEAVREHQGLAGSEVRRDVALIERSLNVVGNQNHHHVGDFGGLGGVEDGESGGLRLGAALAVGGKTHHNIETGIPQVQGVCVALAAIADDGDLFPLQRGDVSVLFVEALWHENP